MNKKIKIITLLNKIANGEEVPKKIKIKKEIYSFEQFMGNFKYFDDYWYTILNDEVEILEDNTEEIEELDNWFVDERKECREFDIQAINLCFSKHRDKINELVKAVNKLRKGNK